MSSYIDALSINQYVPNGGLGPGPTDQARSAMLLWRLYWIYRCPFINVTEAYDQSVADVTVKPPSGHPNGFLALAVYDQRDHGGNGNGRIDSGDAIVTSLLVWVDENHNGISEKNELHHLSDFGIESISLDYSESKFTDEHGNAFRYRARVKFANVPRDVWTYDVFLRRVNANQTQAYATSIEP